MVTRSLTSRDQAARAIDASQRSIQGSPNETAFRNLGDMAFSDGNYKGALANDQEAAKLDPTYHMIWRDIGDCL